VFRNVVIQKSDAGEISQRIHTNIKVVYSMNLKKKNHWKYIDIERRMMLKWI